MKRLKSILFLLAIIAIAILLILNKFLVYGLVLIGIVVVVYFMWHFFIRSRDRKIAEQDKAIEKLASDVRELQQRKINISHITAILELNLIEIDSSYTRVFNNLYNEGKLKFIGALRVDIKAKYGIDIKELRFKYESENDTVLIYNLNPKFLSFSERKCDWLFAETMEYVKPFLGEHNWKIKNRNDKITFERSESIRKQTELELENGIEELKWIEKPLQNQAVNILKTFLFPDKEICLCDDCDDTFMDIDSIHKLVDNNYKMINKQ
jgi:ABC-type multidrug transport system fused ATPase/permease subunit